MRNSYPFEQWFLIVLTAPIFFLISGLFLNDISSSISFENFTESIIVFFVVSIVGFLASIPFLIIYVALFHLLNKYFNSTLGIKSILFCFVLFGIHLTASVVSIPDDISIVVSYYLSAILWFIVSIYYNI